MLGFSHDQGYCGRIDVIARLVLAGCVAALLATTGATLVLRLEAEIGRRRWLRYRARARPALLRFTAGADDTPPPPPRSRFERRAMRHLILGLAPRVRGDASSRLAGLFRAYGMVEIARRDLRARHPRTRIRAVEAFGAMRIAESEPWVLEGLADDDRLMRFASARALADLGAIGALDRVIAALADSEAQLGATSDILLAFGPQATGFLRAHVRSAATERERWLSASALGQLRAADSLDDLRAVLSSADPELAVRAARGLGRIGSSEAGADLALAAQREQSWFVRAAAARSLGKIGDPEAAPLLTAMLGNADRWELRDAAAAALVDLGEPAMEVVMRRMGALPDTAVAHYAGALDVADRLGDVIRRAAGGEGAADRLVRRASAAGVRARLEEMAQESAGERGAYARTVLA